MERYVSKIIAQYLKDHSLLEEEQFGFRPAHSTETALVSAMDELRRGGLSGSMCGQKKKNRLRSDYIQGRRILTSKHQTKDEPGRVPPLSLSINGFLAEAAVFLKGVAESRKSRRAREATININDGLHMEAIV
ncbi:hypothetical protein NDU88_004186 [Pleurodeles waltl]|uniref:Reverse transcriptase domain-containing protein n=1 Tax=Pleurodeles waltl TaxID=8319 RepID=A0AAV7W4B0_PLEWA|nr:hypothetical protein NDU88_004186 [Pleurodeles waltl]